MQEGVSLPSLCGAVVQDVILVDQITRHRPGSFQSESLPGHLIHIVTEGLVEQRTGGCVERFGAGNAVWYHQNESIQGAILEAPWTFYTVNFNAPSLPPPALDQRVRLVPVQIVRRFAELLDVWRDTAMPAMLRHLRIHALLLEVIEGVLPQPAQAHRMDAPTQLWWDIESKIRPDLSQPINLDFLVRLSHRSRRSLIRACHMATGLPPMKRVKRVRLSYARGLVLLSELTMSEIAYRIGYGRVQEFSRDYRRQYGVAPTQDRSAGPDYAARRSVDTSS